MSKPGKYQTEMFNIYIKCLDVYKLNLYKKKKEEIFLESFVTARLYQLKMAEKKKHPKCPLHRNQK